MAEAVVDTVDGALALIEEFNAVHGCVPPLPFGADFGRHACETERSALCLSGGGIRSAAFAIGVLQALAQKRLLGCFDYLSTVSGGGFAGSWLQRLILESGGVTAAEAALAAGAAPAALHNLRNFTSYLTPQRGLFSADSLTGIVLYTRNTLLNWLAFAPFFLGVVLLAVFYRTALWTVGTNSYEEVALLAAAICLGWSTFHGCIMLPSHAVRPAEPSAIRWHCVCPVLLWAILAPIGVVDWSRPGVQLPGGPDGHPVHGPAIHGLLLPAVMAATSLLAYLAAMVHQRHRQDAFWRLYSRNLGVWIASVLFSTGFVALGMHLLTTVPAGDAAGTLAVVGPVWLVMAAVLQTGTYAGFREDSRPRTADLDREWMARLSAVKLRPALAWAAFTVCSLWLSWFLIDGSAQQGDAPFWAVAINTAVTGPAAAWVGKQAFARVDQLGKAAAQGPQLLGRGLQVLSLLFAAGLFTLLGAAVAYSLGQLQLSLPATGIWTAFAVQALLAGVVFLVGWLQARRLNVNRFSLHAVYRNRLARAFLGSPRRERVGDPFTGFDALDNVPLHDLAPKEGERRRLFPVLNMALNLTGGTRAAWAERKAASFTATPLRCGSDALGERDGGGIYAQTRCYAGNEFPARSEAPGTARGLTLATAMTISGAAVSPNWGYHSSPLTAFLMTLFNVRLGAWLPNPATVTDPADLDLAMPRRALRAMLGDLLGQTTGTSDGVYLSDGGHFDNLGLYEMLRRRCRLIVVIDAGQDEKCQFEDLGNAIRKAQIDFPEVSIDMGPLRLRARGAAQEPPANGFAVGRVTYREGADRCWEGSLLYIKPGWLDAMPADVRAYGLRSDAFPHESTADQWFTESQFESYRALGQWQMGWIAAAVQPGDLGGLIDAARRLADGADGAPCPEGASLARG